MSPFEIGPGWYDSYWYSSQPCPEQRSFSGSLVWSEVLAVLLAAGGAALNLFHAYSDADHGQPGVGAVLNQ
jgi:hypothetical protein